MKIVYNFSVKRNGKVYIFTVKTKGFVVDDIAIRSLMNGYMIIVLEFVKINQRSGIIGPHIGIFDRLHITVAQIDVCIYICKKIENDNQKLRHST